MKILWLAHEGSLSGANICLLEYLDILTQKGFDHHLVVPAMGALAAKAKKEDIPVTQILFYSWTSSLNATTPVGFRLRRWLRNKMAVYKLTLLVKKLNPDFVATNTLVAPIAAFAAKKTGKKHIWFIHEFGEEDHGFTIAGGFSKGAKIINRLSHKVVFNSMAVQKKFEPYVLDEKRCIVYNAVNIPSVNYWASPPNEKLRLIMLGQVAPSKNHLEALKALKICRQQGLEFELDIVGKTERSGYLQELNNYIKVAGLQEYVNFLGASSQPTELLQQYHALLMCSHMEAFGRATVEALGLGIPVIAANTGGSLEIIQEGRNGYFYQSGNPEDLALKILKFNHTLLHFDKKEIAAEAQQRFNAANTALQLQKVFC